MTYKVGCIRLSPEARRAGRVGLEAGWLQGGVARAHSYPNEGVAYSFVGCTTSVRPPHLDGAAEVG